MWDRSTPWRQGHVLTPEAVEAFGLCGAEPTGNVAAVVASHDCDLAQPAGTEPTVEVLIGAFLQGEPDGNFTNSKNLRRLHIGCDAGSEMANVELQASSRKYLPKERVNAMPGLEDFLPSTRFALRTNHRTVLQNWLAARYRRAAFPDEFDRRLTSQTKLADKIAAALRPSNNHVVAVFFDVGEPERERKDASDPYELQIILVYSSAPDPQVAERTARECAAAIEHAVRRRCLVDQGGVAVWQWIELVGAVQVISDRALSYADSLAWSKWQADHISLRENPPAPMLE